MYAPHLLSLLLCRWTRRLFPCLSDCKQSCNEQTGACYLFELVFAFISDKWNTQNGVAGSRGSSTCFEEPPYCFPQWLHQCPSLPAVPKGSLLSTSSPALESCSVCVVFLTAAILAGVRGHLSLRTSDTDYFSCDYSPPVCLLGENVRLGLLPIFLNRLFGFFRC